MDHNYIKNTKSPGKVEEKISFPIFLTILFVLVMGYILLNNFHSFFKNTEEQPIVEVTENKTTFVVPAETEPVGEMATPPISYNEEMIYNMVNNIAFINQKDMVCEYRGIVTNVEYDGVKLTLDNGKCICIREDLTYKFVKGDEITVKGILTIAISEIYLSQAEVIYSYD